MDDTEPIYRFNPLISSSKHTRILIWRSEVASASLPDDAYAPGGTNYPSPPSLTTTTTISTTISSSSGPDSSALQRKTLAALARGRRFLSRMTSKIPGRGRRRGGGGVCAHGAPTTSAGEASSSCPPASTEGEATDPEEDVCRTSMYHMLRPDHEPLEHDHAMLLLGLGLGLGAGSPAQDASSPRMGSGAGEEESGGAGAGGKRRFKFLETQARLLRARRLLTSHSP